MNDNLLVQVKPKSNKFYSISVKNLPKKNSKNNMNFKGIKKICLIH